MATATRYFYAANDLGSEDLLDMFDEVVSSVEGNDKTFYLTTQGAYKGQTEVSDAEILNGIVPATDEMIANHASLYVIEVRKVEQTL